MPRTPKIKIASTWYLRSKYLLEPGLTIIIIITIATYVWVTGSEERTAIKI